MKLYCFKVIFQTFSYLYVYYSIFIHKDNKMSINFVRDLKKRNKTESINEIYVQVWNYQLLNTEKASNQ